MKKTKLTVLSTLTALSLLAGGCGNKSSSSEPKTASQGSQAAEEEVSQLDGSHIQGHYRAMFQTLNASVNGTVPGAANFFRKEEKFYAYVRLFAGRVKGWHQQFVYTGGRCPTMKDDTNGDGFIDIVEAERVTGKILIPLDSDISTQNSGRRFFPLADLSGSYSYERIASFDRFLADLQDADPDPADDMVKLAPGEPLVIPGKTVMILGIDEETVLPETVASKGRFRAFQTFPVVCGVFEKVRQEIGRSYSPDDLGRTAEVQPDQDRPAPDDTTTTTGGSTGSGTGTNENEDGEVSDGEGDTRTTTGGSGSTGSSSSGSSTGGRTTGSSTGGSTTSGSTTGGTSGNTTSGSTSGGSTGSSTSGSTTGSTTSGTGSTGGTTGSSTGDSGSTTGSSSSTSSSSTSTSSTSGTTTGGSIGF